jgi:hypothetical protein
MRGDDFAVAFSIEPGRLWAVTRNRALVANRRRADAATSSLPVATVASCAVDANALRAVDLCTSDRQGRRYPEERRSDTLSLLHIVPPGAGLNR